MKTVFLEQIYTAAHFHHRNFTKLCNEKSLLLRKLTIVNSENLNWIFVSDRLTVKMCWILVSTLLALILVVSVKSGEGLKHFCI